MIVFDITSRESFDAAKSWVAELQNTDTLIALAGNKSDLEPSRAVDREMAKSYADQMGILYMETSAKSGQNVNELFHEWLSQESHVPKRPRIAVRLPKQSKESGMDVKRAIA